MELRELFDRFKHSNGKFGDWLVSFYILIIYLLYPSSSFQLICIQICKKLLSRTIFPP